jgi:hypothetical protein
VAGPGTRPGRAFRGRHAPGPDGRRGFVVEVDRDTNRRLESHATGLPHARHARRPRSESFFTERSVGRGASQLHAGSGEDILIGGWTDYDLSSTALTYDRKLAALDALLREWSRTDLGTASDPTGYSARVKDLLGPAAGGTSGRLNGSVFLNPSTVHDNGQADTLFGTTGAALSRLCRVADGG